MPRRASHRRIGQPGTQAGTNTTTEHLPGAPRRPQNRWRLLIEDVHDSSCSSPVPSPTSAQRPAPARTAHLETSPPACTCRAGLPIGKSQRPGDSHEGIHLARPPDLR
ncbi:hypothetical protein CPLU01_15117 [Colletotrichum plurivorum]|uniref:Uncharacterized protein n=1 Tax=Colletotrichum plurivorum TaxID=2175906 RepID=A0A8H6JEI8_9PEZI|nr:hypothetical protein CPLU01_15117 [Colletotrichum plurivorum]